MYPHERSLVNQKYKNKAFALIGVNSDGTRKICKDAIVREKHMTRSFYDGRGGPIAKQYKIEGWPTIFLLDHKGVIRKKWEGVPPTQELDAALDALVAEAGKAKKDTAKTDKAGESKEGEKKDDKKEAAKKDDEK